MISHISSEISAWNAKVSDDMVACVCTCDGVTVCVVWLRRLAIAA